MTRKYDWDQYTKSCARLTVAIYDNDNCMLGLITIVFVAGAVQSCNFEGSSNRPLMVGQEISSAISKGFRALALDGDYDKLILEFEAS